MLSRRHFFKLAGATTGLILSGCNFAAITKSPSAHVIVIGGGFAGATAAKYIRKLDNTIKVTLIEPKANYVTCPASNWVLAGFQPLGDMLFDYHTLADKFEINIVQDHVIAVDSIKRKVSLSDGSKMQYDRLVVSPGIDFRWETIEGYNQESSKSIPHAWKAGEQTLLLHRQLQAMPDGGTVIISAPPNPFRCPPGPYERASMMAYYLKKYKPRSKILILDPKPNFSKQNLFIAGWQQHYGYGTNQSLIEWLSIPDNPVVKVNVNEKTVETDFGDRYKADVLNIIPAQKAGEIAERAGLTDETGWCPVSHASSESIFYPDIHVIGDASIHHPLPKSAFAASSEAKVCAFAVVNMLNDREMLEPTWINTCYSLITPMHGISVAMVYKLSQEGMVMEVKGSGGVTANSDKKTFYLESKYARFWYESITEDAFL